jgi:hypothetical protein
MSIRLVFAVAFAGVLYLTISSRADEKAAAENPTSEAAVRRTIEKSLPYIEAQGLYWIEEKKCASCHRVSFMTWSLSAASRRGFDVDLAKVNEWIDWSITDGIPVSKDDKPVSTNNADGLTQQLLSRHEYPAGATRDTSWSRFVDLIVESQREDGSWKPAGQLPAQKRPQPETTDVSTVWNTAALTREITADGDTDRQETIKAAITAATKKFGSRKEAVSIEWYVARLVLALESDDKAGAAAALSDLLSRQKPDGSWGWLTADSGDALATGMSLYAIVRSRGSEQKHAEAVERAINFLVTTQQKDGSWPVKGTKEKKKANIEETAVYWGTTWATIALLETLPVVE